MRYHLEEVCKKRGWVPYDPAAPVKDAYRHYDPLWVRPAQMELTGKGRVIAIIDHPLYLEHPGYKANLLSYERVGVTKPVTDSHGASVVSIAAGEIGIAKDAQIVYRAFAPWERERYLANVVAAFESLRNYVVRGGAVDVISASFGWMDTTPGAKEANAMIGWFEDRNIPVFSTANARRMIYYGPNGLDEWVRRSALEANAMDQCLQSLALPITNRGLACFCPEQIKQLGSNYYRETATEGGASWAMPFLAGLFADAREAIPTLTKETFWNLLDGSAKTVSFPREDLRVIDTTKFVARVLREKNRPLSLG